MSSSLLLSEARIRRYTPPDADACMACFKSNVPIAFTVEETLLFETFLRERIAQSPENLPYFVLLTGEAIVGCGGLGLNENNTVSLTWGLVHRAFHKEGLGKLLLEHRLREAGKRFPDRPLRLDTTQHAVGFFEKYGFKTVQFTADGYAPGMDRYDMIL